MFLLSRYFNEEQMSDPVPLEFLGAAATVSFNVILDVATVAFSEKDNVAAQTKRGSIRLTNGFMRSSPAD